MKLSDAIAERPTWSLFIIDGRQMTKEEACKVKDREVKSLRTDYLKRAIVIETEQC